MKTKYRPQAAALEVTLRCDMSCIHCGSNASRRDRPDSLSFEEWCGVVDELKKLKVPHCTLSGGEPFLYPRWRELVAYIRKRGLGVNFISNGYNITESDMEFMKAAGVEHIGVSLDGDQAVHDLIRRKPGSFAKVVKLFRMGKDYGIPVYPASSINKINFPVREKMLGIVLDHGIKAWQVQIVNSFGRAGKLRGKLILEPEQFTTLCDDILRWQKATAGRLRILPADSLGYCHPVTDALLGDYEWQGCNAGLYVVGIQADGTVLGCLSLQDKAFSAGNVRQRPLSEIWADDAAFAYTRRHDPAKLEGACKACGQAAVCKAGCLGMAFSTSGTIGRNPYCYKAIVEARTAAGRP
ncbi:MAG: radical SAM protein [Elusimicrobia bacterium]|nr:radical SAM protein [Elusimicrobiota bacterium]